MSAASTRIAAALLLGIGLTVGCARQPIRGQEVSGLDRKLSTFAFIEQGELVTLIVGTRPTRYRLEAPYVPLEVAVANHGMRTLTLTRESFTLVDEEGNRYPLATPSELLETYEFLDMDRELAELEGIVFNKFAANQRYPSNFSPRRTFDADRRDVVLDRVALPRHGYLIDYLYFPRPPGELEGEELELFLDAPELEDPVFVRFTVR